MILWPNNININDNVINIPTKDIVLEEEIHLSCTKINFNGKLKVYYEQRKIETPIAVIKVSDSKYVLVVGVQMQELINR
ncbi:hypothetical protein [Clostridium taeniosporum]|uniref:Uncharacterized protein n=1 Tax=Clostridium taeniosporum TaxID=394958 RepID=A0A1D7XIF1_9CLOT|nr:hypothetical protein [Clostridium taeniosporum]AOR23114.1 hypothetical protein BGI42_04975 [Clostridium taeniosporum]